MYKVKLSPHDSLICCVEYCKIGRINAVNKHNTKKLRPTWIFSMFRTIKYKSKVRVSLIRAFVRRRYSPNTGFIWSWREACTFQNPERKRFIQHLCYHKVLINNIKSFTANTWKIITSLKAYHFYLFYKSVHYFLIKWKQAFLSNSEYYVQ